MAYRSAPVRVTSTRRTSFFRKTIPALALSAIAYTSLTASTSGSRPVDPDAELPPVVSTVSLTYEADRPVISGSVASLFQNDAFVGSNRGERTGRARPKTDVADFSAQFSEQRIQVAQAREAEAEALAVAVAKAEAGEQVAQRVAVAAVDAAATVQERDAERIAVASIDPAATGADALRAIDTMTGESSNWDPSAPRPVSPPATLAYARANTPATDFTPQHEWDERQQWCMSTGIYFEARGESYRGQVAVAQVILNRVAHENYPDTICGVVYQNQHRRNACQFSFACDGIPDRINEPAAWAKAQEVTQEVLNERIYLTEVAEATHYHATYVRPRWARNMTKLSQIGLHVFYRFKDGWRFG